MSEEVKGISASGVSSPAEVQTAGSRASASDAAVIEALRRGDEEAFTRLVDQHHAVLAPHRPAIRLEPGGSGRGGAGHLACSDPGESGRFEGRSSLKTWILRILINRAKTRARREGRTVPFAEARGG